MKRLLPLIVCALAVMPAAALAESAHKPQHKAQPKAPAGVDLEAAAKATAALYANMAAPTAPAATSAAAKTPAAPAAPAAAAAPLAPAAAKAAQALPARPFTPPQPPRPSPLLPEAASTTVVPVAASSPEPAPAPGAVWAGAYQCEHAEKITMRPGQGPDMVELQWKAQRWQMRRVDSRSGAMRLEDASARMVWIQLPNKSMLLDQRQGRRLLDECQHEVQVQTAAQMKDNPPPALFDTRGMGR